MKSVPKTMSYPSKDINKVLLSRYNENKSLVDLLTELDSVINKYNSSLTDHNSKFSNSNYNGVYKTNIVETIKEVVLSCNDEYMALMICSSSNEIKTGKSSKIDLDYYMKALAGTTISNRLILTKNKINKHTNNLGYGVIFDLSEVKETPVKPAVKPVVIDTTPIAKSVAATAITDSSNLVVVDSDYKVVKKSDNYYRNNDNNACVRCDDTMETIKDVAIVAGTAIVIGGIVYASYKAYKYFMSDDEPDLV